MTDRERWTYLAEQKGAMRAAWDQDESDDGACVREILPILPMKGMFLDLGCGAGRLTEPIAKMRPDAFIVGLDVTPKMLPPTEATNVCYVVGDGRSIPYIGDVTSAWSVLLFQHLEQEQVRRYIYEVSAILKPGAAFKFQYVEGGGDRFAMTFEMAVQWCAEADLRLTQTRARRVFDNWCWVTARK